MSEKKALELTVLEHGLALVAALSVAYAARSGSYYGLLALTGKAPSTAVIAGQFFASFRHAIVMTVALLVVNALARLAKPLVLVLLGAFFVAFVAALATVFWDWAADMSLNALGVGTAPGSNRTFVQVAQWQLEALGAASTWFSRLALAAGLFLTARGKGRWTEGFRFSAPLVLAALAQLPFLRTPFAVKVAWVAAVFVMLAVTTVLVPLAERLVKRAFAGLGIGPEPPA